MFDDNLTGGAEPPKNLPIAEPDDMFAKVDNSSGADMDMAVRLEKDSALDNGLLKKKPIDDLSVGSASLPRVNTIPQTEIYETKEPVIGKIFVILLIVAAATGLGYGAWKFYADYTENTGEPLKQDELKMTTEPEVENVVENIPVEEKTTVTTTAPAEEIVVDESVLDDDKDGLNNAREKELGTNLALADTDKDELRDGDEVTIWQTDPLNPDSDDDGFKDGEEIKNGYNPLGTGKLFNNDVTSTEGEDQTVNI